MITTNTTEQLLIPVNLQNIKHFDCTCSVKIKTKTSLKETCSNKITLQYHRINQNVHKEKFLIQKKYMVIKNISVITNCQNFVTQDFIIVSLIKCIDIEEIYESVHLVGLLKHILN